MPAFVIKSQTREKFPIDCDELINKYHYKEEADNLKKILDTNELGFKKFKVKVFEIDYNKFHELRS